MGTRISVDVAQALLAQRVKALAAANRGQRLEREQGERDKAKIQGAIERGVDGAAGSGGGSGGIGGPSGNGRGRAGQAASASPLADLDAQLRAGTLRSGVPEYESRPRVAVPFVRKGWVLGPSNAELKVRTKRVPPFSFIFNIANPGEPIDPADGIFLPGGGPVSGTGAFSIPSSGGAGAIQAYGAGVTKEPAGHAYTYEFMAKLFNSSSGSGSSTIASGVQLRFGNFFARLGLYEAEGSGITVRVELGAGPVTSLINVASSSSSETGVRVLPELAGGGFFHYAVVVRPGASDSQRRLSMYANGKKCYQEDQDWPAEALFWDNYSFASVYADLGSPAIHGFRFTSSALYAGETFTPPTSITRPA